MADSVHTMHSHAWIFAVVHAVLKFKSNRYMYLFDAETAEHLLFAKRDDCYSRLDIIIVCCIGLRGSTPLPFPLIAIVTNFAITVTILFIRY